MQQSFLCILCAQEYKKNSTCCFAYLAIQVVKHYSFLNIFKSVKTQFFIKTTTTTTIFLICLLLVDNLSKIIYISLWLMMSHPVTLILQLPLRYCSILCIFRLINKQVIVLNIETSYFYKKKVEKIK